LTASKTAFFTITGMLTADGRCKTLDATADGYVRSETCIVHCIGSVSTQSSPAIRDEDLVAILGSAVNQDGRSSSLTAPNGPAQQEVLRAAAMNCLLSDLPRSFELHGTGTALGDPIEIGALVAFASHNVRINANQRPLAVSAVKSRAGHSETGAGALGILQAIRRQTNLGGHPITHLVTMNPYVATVVEKGGIGGIAVPRQGVPEPMAAPVGISSFAFQGTNAHLVLSAPQATVFNAVPSYGTDTLLPWRKRRTWYAPPYHSLIRSVKSTFGTTMATFHCGECLLGPSAALEIAAAAVIMTAPRLSKGSSNGLSFAISSVVLMPTYTNHKTTEINADPSRIVSCQLALKSGSLCVSFSEKETSTVLEGLACDGIAGSYSNGLKSPLSYINASIKSWWPCLLENSLPVPKDLHGIAAALEADSGSGSGCNLSNGGGGVDERQARCIPYGSIEATSLIG
jgi:hypothetical protein